mgnify:CR=1 FL=1
MGVCNNVSRPKNKRIVTNNKLNEDDNIQNTNNDRGNNALH